MCLRPPPYMPASLLQSVADEKQMRFSVLSGDVHCAGYGMFHSRPADVKPDDAEEVPLPPADTRIADAGFIPQVRGVWR